MSEDIAAERDALILNLDRARAHVVHAIGQVRLAIDTAQGIEQHSRGAHLHLREELGHLTSCAEGLQYWQTEAKKIGTDQP